MERQFKNYYRLLSSRRKCLQCTVTPISKDKQIPLVEIKKLMRHKRGWCDRVFGGGFNSDWNKFTGALNIFRKGQSFSKTFKLF